MPKQKRWALKRLLDHACEDIERAQAHLASVYSEFDAPHPELAQYLYAMGQALEAVKQTVEQFRDEAI